MRECLIDKVVVIDGVVVVCGELEVVVCDGVVIVGNGVVVVS